MSKDPIASTTARPTARDLAAADAHPEPPSVDDPRLDTWRAFLYAQSALMPRLDADLRKAAGLTLAEFDALAQLGLAPQQRLRMSDLAERVLLSRSGVTRLVDRLEHNGDVRRESSAPDGRGAYAVLTKKGADRVRTAMLDHLAAVDAHFLDHIDPSEMTPLLQALGRVAQANGRPLPSSAASATAMRRITE
ncbi:MAG: MarR family winged helix-turn-helix transcriptional regulator [Chloroflexota bacterium]